MQVKASILKIPQIPDGYVFQTNIAIGKAGEAAVPSAMVGFASVNEYASKKECVLAIILSLVLVMKPIVACVQIMTVGKF